MEIALHYHKNEFFCIKLDNKLQDIYYVPRIIDVGIYDHLKVMVL